MTNMIEKSIKKLVCYGLDCGLFDERDQIFVTNRILEILNLDEFCCDETFQNVDLEQTLKELLDYACEKGIIDNNITERDLFDTKLMSAMMPRPSEVTNKFWELYNDSPKPLPTGIII
jgi:UDPglucose--hexose-1-phosphate uridylyltransferase